MAIPEWPKEAQPVVDMLRRDVPFEKVQLNEAGNSLIDPRYDKDNVCPLGLHPRSEWGLPLSDEIEEWDASVDLTAARMFTDWWDSKVNTSMNTKDEIQDVLNRLWNQV